MPIYHHSGPQPPRRGSDLVYEVSHLIVVHTAYSLFFAKYYFIYGYIKYC